MIARMRCHVTTACALQLRPQSSSPVLGMLLQIFSSEQLVAAAVFDRAATRIV